MAAIKILLVDDDEVLNIIMRSLLEREGFDITVACNVAEARAWPDRKGVLSAR
jgi:DNA-binding response OmpR family regulator